jgi:hypothetical protein
MEMEEKNRNCSFRASYTAIQRLKFYPFNQAKEIKIVSFENLDSGMVEGTLPMSKGSVDLTKLKEAESLSHVQIDQLTNLLYNIGYGGPFSIISESGCYNPRNAILFLDSANKVFAFIELCFECEGHRISSSKVKAGEFCNEKYELLKTFFLSNGITYVTRKEVDDQ